jgi:hypothetical protein
MTTDPVPARPNGSAEDTPDPDSLPIDPADVTHKPLDRDRDRGIEAEPLTTDTSKA